MSKTHTNIYRNSDTRELERIARSLEEQGFRVTITHTDNPWTDGPSYITTDAPMLNIMYTAWDCR